MAKNKKADKETSKTIETSVMTQDNKEDFDPKKFNESTVSDESGNDDNINDNKINKKLLTVEEKTRLEEEETKSKKPSEKKEEPEFKDEDTFYDWNDIGNKDLEPEPEPEPEPEEEPELEPEELGEGPFGKKETVKTDIAEIHSPDDGSRNWTDVATELGIQAQNFTELIEHIKSNRLIVEGDDKIININTLLAKSPREKVTDVMRAQANWNEEEIEEYIDKLESEDNLKYTVKQIDSDLLRQKQQHISLLEKKKKDEQQQKYRTQLQFTEALKSNLGNKQQILGGSIDDSARNKIYSHIISGKFQDSIISNMDTLVELAFFNVNKDKVLAALKQSGISEGKKIALSKFRTTQPMKKNGMIVKDKSTAGFNPDEFMAGR